LNERSDLVYSDGLDNVYCQYRMQTFSSDVY